MSDSGDAGGDDADNVSDSDGDAGDVDVAGERVRVCEAAALPPGEYTLVGVDGVQVGVLNVDGDYYAIQNECAHQGGPVCEGNVRPELVGEFVEPGQRVTERHGERLTIACPWHGWEYDLETGRHLGVDDIAVHTYEVVEDGGVLYVETSADSEASQ